VPVQEGAGPVGQIMIKNAKNVHTVPPCCALIAPKHAEYMSWAEQRGHSSNLRFCSIREHRHDQNHEGLHLGQITAGAITVDGRTVVTAGEDMMVQAWELGRMQNRFQLKLRGQLHGHNQPVCSVAVNKAHGVIISGDRDGLVIVWDFVKLRQIRTLDRLNGPIRIVGVHAISGLLIAATQKVLAVWTINGALLALQAGDEPGMAAISAVAYSFTHDWDEDSVYVTGHEDGTVRFWSIKMGTAERQRCGELEARAMCLRHTLDVSDHGISTIHSEESQLQSLWIGDIQGNVYHASVGAAAGPVSFNALAVAGAND